MQGYRCKYVDLLTQCPTCSCYLVLSGMVCLTHDVKESIINGQYLSLPVPRKEFELGVTKDEKQIDVSFLVLTKAWVLDLL